jgi:hypothetical protein
VRTGRVKALVVAPNIEPSPSEGGLDDAVAEIVTAARAAEPPIPVFFALSRKRMGRALGKSVRVAAAALCSFENLHGLPSRALELLAQLREQGASPARVVPVGPVAVEGGAVNGGGEGPIGAGTG